MDLGTRAALVTFALTANGSTLDDAWAEVDAAVEVIGEPVDEAGLRAVMAELHDAARVDAGV